MGSFECDDFYFYIFSIALRKSQLDGHKYRKLLVLENQEQKWKNSTPNRQMQQFLHCKTDPNLISQHKVQCNYINVVCLYYKRLYTSSCFYS